MGRRDILQVGEIIVTNTTEQSFLKDSSRSASHYFTS
jgi:hypothetical protein